MRHAVHSSFQFRALTPWQPFSGLPTCSPILHQTRFVKTWAWAMPERAQLLGLMVYRVVDDVTWIELARDLPGIVPRGLPGHRRYF